MAGWLDLLLKQTEESEAPERYFWWSGIAAISAVVRKNVWFNRHYYKLYPNVYVLLISTKSGARKGIPISICKNILEGVEATRIISGCNSIQGLIQELGQQKTMPNGAVIGDAHGILLTDELDSFLTDDPKSLTYLTALYNTHEHEKGWEKTLKNSPKLTLKAPCLTLLAASNEMLFDSVVKRKDIEGGFIGRSIIVRESKPRLINSLVDPPKNPLNYTALELRLIQISKIRGQFEFTPEAREVYRGWYEDIYGADHDDRTGTFNRIGDQVLKVGMLISLSRKDDLILDVPELEESIDKCTECAGAAAKITPSVESSNGDKPNARKLVMAHVIDADAGMVKAKLFGRLQQYQVFPNQIDQCLEEFIKAGWITKAVVPGIGNINNRTIYKLTDEGKLMFLKTGKRIN